MKRAPGWWWRLPAVMVLVGGFFVVLASTIGPVLGAVNPAVDWVAARIGASP